MACRLQSGQPSSRVSVSSTDEFLLFLPCVSWHFSSSLLSWFYINFENSDIFLLYLNNLQCHQLWYLPASLKSAPMISLMFRYRYMKLAQDSQQLLGEKPIAVSPFFFTALSPKLVFWCWKRLITMILESHFISHCLQLLDTIKQQVLLTLPHKIFYPPFTLYIGQDPTRKKIHCI